MGCLCVSKEIISWDSLKEYQQGGQSIWLTEKQTVNALNFQGILRYIFNPFSGGLTVESREQEWLEWKKIKYNIPYTGYSLPSIHTSDIIPPGLQVARKDLWSIEVFHKWKKEQEINRLKRLGIISTSSE